MEVTFGASHTDQSVSHSRGTPDAMDVPQYSRLVSDELTTGLFISMSSGTVGCVSHANSYMDSPF
jgi:hypothetical protein